MKSRRRWFLGIGIFLLFGIASLPTHIQTARNYKLETIRMPLGWKTIHFLSRHHQMILLAREIISSKAPEEEKAMAVYRWVRAHIYRGVPAGLPVMDDHVLYVAVRGYGTEDQMADLFTALCTYVGLTARWSTIYSKEGSALGSVSMVRITGRWVVMDPFRDYIARIPSGELEDLQNLQGRLRRESVNLGIPAVRGASYEQFLLILDQDAFLRKGVDRGSSQIPLRRIWGEIKKRFL